MFQNAWFDKTEYIPFGELPQPIPSSFVTTDEMFRVRTLYFDEHCLECSAPACYGTCQKYAARADGACKLFSFGYRHAKPPKGQLWSVDVQYREWGKLEARINKGTLTPKQLLKLDRADALKTKLFKLASRVSGSKNYALSGKWDGLKRKKYAEIPADTPFADTFLFQCYSFEKESFGMNFEITDEKNNVIFKTGFTLQKGYNKQLLSMEFDVPEGGLVRLYPENNVRARLRIFACDFVQLKKDVPAQPAKKLKCVAWDLDNTLWEGILMESDPEKLMLREGVKHTIEQLDRRGIIQMVLSKNDKAQVLPVLERLGVEPYFVLVCANWSSKAMNLYHAARMLNIGLDTFALVDDSAFERGEVSETLPCVRVYEESDVEKILTLPETDLKVSAESAARRLSYRQELARKQVRESAFAGNNTDFIKSCEIKIKIAPLQTEEQKKRSLELVSRTNQLNLSTTRYSAEEFEALVHEQGAIPLVLYVSDRFGDYGQVAFLLLKPGEVLTISEYVMSCRVAAKLVEPAVFAALQKKYQKEIVMVGKKTARNGTLTDALAQCGFSSEGEGERIEMHLPQGTVPKHADINEVIWL